MSSHASFILFAGYYYITLACLNGYLCLAMKRAMTKEDNEAWNCPSQRNHWHGIRIPWGGLPCPSLFKLGYSFHMQWTSEQHWVLLNGFRAPYGNCLGSWHQAKEWQCFSPFVFIYLFFALYLLISENLMFLHLLSAQCHVLLTLCTLQH